MYEHFREAPTEGMVTKNVHPIIGKTVAYAREAVFGILDGIPVANLIPKLARAVI